MIRVKYSKGPKRVAMMDNGFVIVAKVIQEISPPTKEAVIPSPSALPGLPPRAIGYPSKVVMTAAGVPGILNRVAVINPPLIAPTYIEVRRMIAFKGSM